MISVGGLWGVPMMLSGAVQRRYSCSSAAATRLAMADRVRMMMMRRRPVMRIARPVIHRRACRQELCRAHIPPGANFCPRCGTRTVAVLNDVA
jgi:hypothetical protein